MKIAKKIAFALLLILVAMQFFHPEKNLARGDHTAAFLIETNPSSDIQTLLMESCYDCHSNETRYPWYNNVAPISYWLADHIKDGKKHLNFSEWDGYTVKEKEHKIEEIIKMVGTGEMPLKEYTWTHEEAKLSEEQRNEIKQWAERTRALYQLNQPLK